MTLQEIKKALSNGQTVNWKTELYEVTSGENDMGIKCQNGSYVGLHIPTYFPDGEDVSNPDFSTVPLPNTQEWLEWRIEQLSCESNELIDYPRDIHEASHEHADGHEDVIYFAKAHSNVQSAGRDELTEAESRFEDCGGVGDDAEERGGVYDRAAQLLSFHLEEYRFQELVRGELEEIRDDINETRDNVENAISEYDEPLDNAIEADDHEIVKDGKSLVEFYESEIETLNETLQICDKHLEAIETILG